VRAYRMLLQDPHRAGHGYSLQNYFTRDLDWGSEPGVIHASHPPLTMCNAAVTETFIEAVNLYTRDNPSWLPQNVMPTELWNKGGFAGLKAHFLSHNLLEYPPLEHIPRKEIPASLQADIKQFQSEEAMAKAIERWGVGERIKFQNARPGDIITFDRTNDRIDGSHASSGHSVVFLGFLDRNQNILDKYDASKVSDLSISLLKDLKERKTRADWAKDGRTSKDSVQCGPGIIFPLFNTRTIQGLTRVAQSASTIPRIARDVLLRNLDSRATAA
jgi:hypothetical protein